MSQSTALKTPITEETVEPLETGLDTLPDTPPAKNALVAALQDQTMRGPLFWSIIGRSPIYLVAIALVVATTSRGSTYLSAGLLLAGYTLGVALLAPFVARRVDRYGQPSVLLITGIVYPVALIGFVYAANASLTTQLACVVVAGATNPPLSGCIRSLWSTSGSTMERVGLSIEAVLGEIFSIGGPLLLSLVLFWGSADTALILGGLLAGVGAIGFAMTRASRATQATKAQREATGERDPLGALRSPGLVRLLFVLATCGIAAGVYNVAVPAFVTAHGSAQDIGLIFGVWGIGGIIGGLWYGSHTLRQPAERAFAVGLLAMGACAALVLLAWDNWSIAAALFLLGAVGAPVTAISYQLVARTARADYVTEAFTWAITVSLAGSAVGAQLGGLVINASDTEATLLAVVVIMVAAAAGAYAMQHRFADAAEAEPAS
ncbi:MFS transporter [Catellatospora chokoriensis]|uniref:MFS transporter n=1 Tax=Catellatospora chokoriensis TaxID=310353 RepID=A0A8J3NRR0_9ACTN|nr:MFS transporter [Catellatospora chokoriensis]GIF90205.1 MFS transporter [Catellatospora chokoriensis]